MTKVLDKEQMSIILDKCLENLEDKDESFHVGKARWNHRQKGGGWTVSKLHGARGFVFMKDRPIEISSSPLSKEGNAIEIVII